MSERFAIYNEDCIAGMAARLEADSVHLCVTSIPFGALFQYSGKTEDIGNNPDGIDMRASQFGLHLRFAIEQLYRVMEPGSITCIHIQQLRTTKVQHGFMGRRDLRAATIDCFAAGGFEWTGELVIPKDPQIAAQKQIHSLLFLTGKRDSRALAPAVNDYILVFRKPGEGTPVRAIYDPNLNPHGWLTTDEWIRDARGLWADIRETDVLTGWQDGREEDDEKHVCPLQLTVIRRLVRLYANPDALVLDPFSGIGSAGVVALEQGRRYVGFELKTSYWDQSIRNCALELRRQEAEKTLPLFEAAGVAVE